MIMTGCAKSIGIALFVIVISLTPFPVSGAPDSISESTGDSSGSGWCSVEPWCTLLGPPEEGSCSDTGSWSPSEDLFSPGAHDCTVTTQENTPIEITLRAIDPDAHPMIYSIDSGPFHGTLGPINGHRIIYTPENDFVGTDSFVFSANDGYWDSNPATATITVAPDMPPVPPEDTPISPPDPPEEPGDPIIPSQAFFGSVTIDGIPAPENTVIVAEGPGVNANTQANPVTTQADGSYGAPDALPENLIVEGNIENGTPLAFFVNGTRAEVQEVLSGGPWQSTWPFRANEVTQLDIRATTPVPPPDFVYITAIGMTIANPEIGFSQDIRLEENPNISLVISPGIFYVDFYMIGGHAFFDRPLPGRVATIGIFENGIPLVVKNDLWFGSTRVDYAYRADETRTFDIMVYVNEDATIRQVKHINISVVSP